MVYNYIYISILKVLTLTYFYFALHFQLYRTYPTLTTVTRQRKGYLRQLSFKFLGVVGRSLLQSCNLMYYDSGIQNYIED